MWDLCLQSSTSIVSIFNYPQKLFKQFKILFENQNHNYSEVFGAFNHTIRNQKNYIEILRSFNDIKMKSCLILVF